MSIPEIFKRHGEPYFRERESAVLESLLSMRRHVFATGGGIVTQPENLPLLRRLGMVVLLRADPEEIYRRVSRNTDRPLLQVENPRERVFEMMADRLPLYEQAAQFQVDSTTLRHDEVATVGTANNASRISQGLIVDNRTIVTPSRSTQPAVENTDMYMWSNTKIWFRSTDRRSR